MSTTYTLTAGGIEWIIGTPETEEPVKLTVRGKDWPMAAVKAVSAKGTFKVITYVAWAWRPESRPLDRDMFIAIDARGHVLSQSHLLHNLLWGLATGKDPACLDISTTATLADEPPMSRRQQPRQSQPHRVEPRATQEPPRQSTARRSERHGPYPHPPVRSLLR